MLLLVAAKVLYATEGSYFFSDDFLNFIIARDMGMSWQYLARSAQGEFIPLFRFASWGYFHLFGIAFLPYRLIAAAYQCAIVLIAVSFVPRDRRLDYFVAPSLILLAFSPVFDASFQWWSAATNVLAETLMSLMALRFMASTAPLTLMRQCLSTAFFIAAMCFFPKGLFAASMLAGFRTFALLERGGAGLRQALRTLAKEMWPIFLSGTLYVAIVVLGQYQAGVPKPSAALFMHYLWRGWNHGFLTGMLGLDQGFFFRVLSANLLIFGLIITSIVRYPRVLVLWAGFFAFFLVATATIAINRAVPFGIESSETSRYYADTTCFFIVTLLSAFARGLAPSQWSRGIKSSIVAAMVSVMAAQLLGSSSRVAPVWYVPGEKVARFVNNVSISLRKADPHTQIADGNVPDWVMPQWTDPLRSYKYFLLLFPRSQGEVSDNQPKLRFSDEGQLVAVAANRSR